MSDFEETMQGDQPVEHGPVSEGPVEGAKPVAFCQNCGRPLDEATKRLVGPAVYCEPCLQARLGGRPAAGAGMPGGFGEPASWSIPSSWNPGSVPNPGLAALLGFIPGVGAMYNEQYAKGFVHLAVFVVLVSLSHAAGIFTLLVFGWEAYMVVEAHHTARARRDGMPLPNPFGLNDIGERLGFARTWPAPGTPGYSASRQAPPPAGTPFAGQPFAGGVPPVPPNQTPGGWTPTATGVPPGTAAPWGASAEGFDPHAGVPPTSFPGGSYGAQYRPVHGAGREVIFGEQGVAGSGNGPVQGTSAEQYAQQMEQYAKQMEQYAQQVEREMNQRFGQGSGSPPYGVPYAPVLPAGLVEPPVVPRGSRFPAGAVWLIGLGTLFLLSTTGIFETMLGWSMVGFVLIGLAVWIFVTRMSSTGPLMGDNGTPGYMLRVVRALWPSVWIGLTGVLLLLNEFNLLTWKRSWPLYIILAGVMTLVQRAALNTAAQSMQYGAPPVASTPMSSPYSVVPPADDAKDSSSNEGVR